MISNTLIDTLTPDDTNPRKPEQARMALLRLSLQKLGFLLPMYATPSGLVLSGHQRLAVSKSLEYEQVPVDTVDIPPHRIKGINIIMNRGTNDFTAFDTGQGTASKLHYSDVIDQATALDDFPDNDWYALYAEETSLKGFGRGLGHLYNKKSTVMAENLLRLNIRMPIVQSESGQVINGVHRMFCAKENGEKTWPVVTIPDAYAALAQTMLNYLSMDFAVDDQFADVLRYSAFRRPQNNRGAVPKAYRFWANGNRTLPDSESYSTEYWMRFREFHGESVVDFGAGLCKVAPFLRTKGMECVDFEPYRIDMTKEKGKPCPELSRREAKRFLDEVADGRRFTSIFLASVLNSVPFPKDRLCVLAIVHALSDRDTGIYATCRDISDFVYEYGGIRNANYFVFDSEPGVRVGDVINNPKIQKFMTTEESKTMFGRFWSDVEVYPGGNVHYVEAHAPKTVNKKALREALLFEFNLPYADRSTMGLGEYALKSFSKRLKTKL